MTDMNTQFGAALAAGQVMISDGASGTNLQFAGLPIGRSAETWVRDEPEKIMDLHRAFVDAGSDIILSCSFGGNRLCVESFAASEPVAAGESDFAQNINYQAAVLTRSVADDTPRTVFVAGSMGPTGKMIEPLGPLTAADVTAAYAEQAAALAAGGVDLLLLETFYDLGEAKAAIAGVQQASDLPLICSFSYDRGLKTMMGVSPEQMVDTIAPLGVVALGANCGTSPEDMEKIVTELARLQAGLPLWVKPNAGLPTGSPPRYELTPEEMADHAVRYVELGAQIVGGCCGNSPAHIKQIARAVRSELIGS